MVRIGFIGCHEISWHCLKKICELSLKNNDDVCIVFNLSPMEALKHSGSASFNTLQERYGFPLYLVSNVSDEENIQLLKDAKLDVLFIIGWHRIVPQKVLDQAKIILGIHSSLLPKDRGSSPINWQLIRGEKKGGVTLFHLTTGVDSGPIVDSKEYLIKDSDNIRTVYFNAISVSLSLLDMNWPQIHTLKVKSIPQNESDATTNSRRRPEDGLIDWTKSSKSCYDWIRALTLPYPGAFTFWNGKKVFLWESALSNEKETKPGEIIQSQEKIVISTGKGCLELLLLQIENEPLCNSVVFSHTYDLKKGGFFSLG